MDNKIFRKISVDRLSSPESLDQMMRVVPAKNWMALICLFVIAAVVVAWAFLGEIARQVQSPGVMFSSGGAPGDVVAVFSAEDGSAIQTGMEAIVVFPVEKNAFLAGRVAAFLTVGGDTVDIGGESIPASSLTSRALRPGDVWALVRLDAGEAAKAEKILAAVNPEPVSTSAGWPCRVEVVVERFPPYRLVLPD